MRSVILFWFGLFGFTSLMYPAQAEPTPGSWVVPAQLRCLFMACATFYPADGSPPQPQSWRSGIELTRPGRLVVESSETLLEQPLSEQQLELGPGTLLYLGGARFQPLAGMSLSYRHVSSARAPLEILLPTFILGTVGTQFELLPLSLQELAVIQHEGQLLWRRLDAPLAPPNTLEAGKVLTLSTLQPLALSLEPQQSHGVRSVRSVASKQTPAELLRILDEERLSARLLLEDETLAQLGSELVPGMTLPQRLTVAQLLSTTRAEQPVAGRVLFQLWLQARLTPSETLASEQLKTLLEEHFASTSWPAQLAGVLLHEAMLAEQASPSDFERK